MWLSQWGSHRKYDAVGEVWLATYASWRELVKMVSVEHRKWTFQKARVRHISEGCWLWGHDFIVIREAWSAMKPHNGGHKHSITFYILFPTCLAAVEQSRSVLSPSLSVPIRKAVDGDPRAVNSPWVHNPLHTVTPGVPTVEGSTLSSLGSEAILNFKNPIYFFFFNFRTVGQLTI